MSRPEAPPGGTRPRKARTPKRPPGDPGRAVAYLRVSTDDQQLGPDAQRALIEAWAAQRGVVVVSWHEDLGLSGGASVEDRPGLADAIEAVRQEGARYLVAAKRDRIARDIWVCGTVERMLAAGGAVLATADGVGEGDSPEAQFLRGMLDLVAQFERALIRARTRAAMRIKARRGELLGEAPLGYRVVPGRRSADGRRYEVAPRLEPDEREQRAIRLARQWRAEGRSLAAIGQGLVAEGIGPRQGTRWHPQQVARLVAREEASCG